MSIETYQGNGRATVSAYQTQPSPAPANVVALMEWAQSAQAAHEVATSLVQSSFVPQAFRGKPHEATAAILAGLELGLNPMAALRAFDVIQNAAAPKAITLRAVVQSRGHDIWVDESTGSRAIVKGRRAGSDRVQESVWTLDRARGLGLLGKDNWKKQPGAMLVARATSEVCRLIASDAILGLPYTSEELADGATDYTPMPADVGQDPTQPSPTRRTAQRRTKPQPTPVATAQADSDQQGPEQSWPALPGEEGFEDQPDEGSDEQGITKAQLTKLHTVFSTGGIDNRDTRLQACRLIVGREIGSSTELTKAEASRLIDQLEQLAEGSGHDPKELAVVIAELIGQAEDGDPS
jgi:hypothetical protein